MMYRVDYLDDELEKFSKEFIKKTKTAIKDVVTHILESYVFDVDKKGCLWVIEYGDHGKIKNKIKLGPMYDVFANGGLDDFVRSEYKELKRIEDAAERENQNG